MTLKGNLCRNLKEKATRLKTRFCCTEISGTNKRTEVLSGEKVLSLEKRNQRQKRRGVTTELHSKGPGPLPLIINEKHLTASITLFLRTEVKET